MRTLFHKACAVTGGIVFLAGTAFIGDSLALAAVWLAASISLLFAGKAFSFQQKQ